MVKTLNEIQKDIEEITGTGMIAHDDNEVILNIIQVLKDLVAYMRAITERKQRESQ